MAVVIRGKSYSWKPLLASSTATVRRLRIHLSMEDSFPVSYEGGGGGGGAIITKFKVTLSLD